MTNLDLLVDNFRKNGQLSLDKYLFTYHYYHIKNYISHAIGGLPIHHYKMSRSFMEPMADYLWNHRFLILRCKSFDAVLELVCDCNIDECEPIYLYDTSLLLSSRLHIYPKDVFLYGHALIGAERVLGNSYKDHLQYFQNRKTHPYVPTHIFPDVLKSFKPYHLESFLYWAYNKIITFQE